MARPRKPTKVKEIAGTIRPVREAANEPQPDGLAECPEVLSVDARAEWDRLAPNLMACGLLTAVDTAIFAGYCQAWADYRKLTQQLNSMASWVWQSDKGYRQAVPEVSLQKDAWGRILQAAARLGLDPSSRSGMNVPVAKPEKNKFSRRPRRVS